MSARKTKTVLILGATSGIARALAHEYTRRKYSVILAGRDAEELETIAADLKVRYAANVVLQAFDATNYRTHNAFWKRCLASCDGNLHGVILCYGTMTPQEDAQNDFAATRAMIDSNYTSAISVLNIAANYYETRRRGFIGVVTSVAGERGRQSNYIYGSAKGGLSIYLQGLRMRLAKVGVSVTTIKPGPIDTGMTWGMEKLPLLAPPEKAAADIFHGVRRRKDIVYTPSPWFIIMNLLKLIPEGVWKKTKL